MSLNNTQTSYGLVAKIFHWLVAVLVIGLICVGVIMTEMAFSPTKMEIYNIHKLIGLTVLGLVILRLGWRFYSPPPPPLDGHQKWEKILARCVHIFFYIALIGMPVSGWIMTSAAGFPVSFFGLFDVPDLVAPDADLADRMKEIHGILGYVLAGTIALHIAGALKHHLIDKDRTLMRMIKIFAWAAVLSFAALPAGAASWQINHDASQITFEATQSGARFTGEFKEFTGDITFDPDDLENSRAVIRIDINSVVTGSRDRDSYIGDAAWFNVSMFPEAVFETDRIEHVKDRDYIAHARLMIRGTTQDVTLPFQLVFDESMRNVAMRGTLTLQRLDFDIGSGEWADTRTVGNDVRVEVRLSASR